MSYEPEYYAESWPVACTSCENLIEECICDEEDPRVGEDPYADEPYDEAWEEHV